MMTCDYKDLKCTRCGGTIAKGDSYTGSFQRPRHYRACQPAAPAAAPRRTRALDSYERECEEEGIPMGYRSY